MHPFPIEIMAVNQPCDYGSVSNVCVTGHNLTLWLAATLCAMLACKKARCLDLYNSPATTQRLL